MIDFITVKKNVKFADLDSKDWMCVQSRPNLDVFVIPPHKMTLNYNYRTEILTIECSLPYLLLGHNRYQIPDGTRIAINTIECMIGVDLSDAEIVEFEYGFVLQPEFSTQLVFNSHLEMKNAGKSVRPWTRGRISGVDYKTKGTTLKLYDYWANISRSQNKVSSQTRKRLLDEGYHPQDNSLKIEIHIRNPRMLNLGKTVTVDTILNDMDFLQRCHDKLLRMYSAVEQGRSVELPLDKKKADTISICLMIIINNGLSVEGQLTKLLNCFPKNTFTASDKGGRRKRIRDRLKSLKIIESRYTLRYLIGETPQ